MFRLFAAFGGFRAGKVVPDTLLSSFAAAWRFRKRAVRQQKRSRGHPGAPRSCGSVAKRLLEPAKQSVNTGKSPRPRKVRKSPTAFFGPGQAFFFVLLFRPGKRRTPGRAAPPAAGRGTSPAVLRRRIPRSPARGATPRPDHVAAVRAISTLAPREGSDRRPISFRSIKNDFNPRSP